MPTSDTSWKLYTSNPETWRAMIDACDSATESIDFEIFIFTADDAGKELIDVCARKAAEGVRVRFIWDAAGSFTFFGSSIKEDLQKKGIELLFFKTLIPGLSRLHDYRSWYFRNHRRTLVVDGKIGFTGSTCFSMRMEKWRDSSVEVEGMVVADMQREFERTWLRAQGRQTSRLFPPQKSDHEFQYITNDPMPRRRFLYRCLVEEIRSAEKSIYITVPYFVPPHRLARVIRLAAHRGVDVQLILPESSDFPTVDLGARTYFHQLLKAGVKIHLYRGKVLHAKTVVIDGEWSTLGTLNLDHISLLYNFEANIVSTNKEFAKDLTAQFREDLKSTHEVLLGEWDRRFFVEKIATFIVRLFRVFL